MKMYVFLCCALLTSNQTLIACSGDNGDEFLGLTSEEVGELLSTKCSDDDGEDDDDDDDEFLGLTSDEVEKLLSGFENEIERKGGEEIGSQSKRRKKMYLNYNRAKPHSKEMTTEFEALLTEKELVLKSETGMYVDRYLRLLKAVGDKILYVSEHEWQELHLYPISDHKQYWDSYCIYLWPGVAGDFKAFRRWCSANQFTLRDTCIRRTPFQAFKHDYNPEIHTNTLPFAADLLACDCKYIHNKDTKKTSSIATAQSASSRTSPGISGTRRHFYAMKFSETEYFLLIKVDKVANSSIRTSRMLKVVDYVELPVEVVQKLKNLSI